MATSIKILKDDVTGKLQKMVEAMDDNRAFIKRAVIPMYSNAQRKRFVTENRSEGDQWLPIKQSTLNYKLKNFSDYPGGGKKMLIRTGDLYKSLFPGGDKNKTLVEKRSFVTLTEVDYAKYVDEVRPLMEFRTLKQAIKEKYVRFLATGVING
jgi:phage gpG-like protein